MTRVGVATVRVVYELAVPGLGSGWRVVVDYPDDRGSWSQGRLWASLVHARGHGDRVRDALAAKGYTVRDHTDGLTRVPN